MSVPHRKNNTNIERLRGFGVAALAATIVIAGAFPFALSGSGKESPTAPNAAEIKISSEITPAGGTAQVKFSLTEPRPIVSSGTSMYMDQMAVDGVAVWSKSGQAGGLGVLKNGILTITTVDPGGDLGMNPDYPFITVTMDVPAATAAGTVLPLDWTNPWLNGTAGPLSLTVKPGSVKTGGSLFIRGVYPGGGTYPAGTVIRITGKGFGTFTHLQTTVKYSAISITPTEIDLTLKNQTTMEGQSFEVSNPDGIKDNYFAYLRGTPVRAPSRPMLLSVEPAFPRQTSAIATVGPLPALSTGQFVAVALQNPTPGPLVVTFELKSQGTFKIGTVLLPAWTRVVDDLSVLLGGAILRKGDIVSITSTSSVQMLGITADSNTGAATPFLPTF